MIELLQHDTAIWVTFSFILFALVAYRLGRKSVTQALNNKIEAIRKEIQTAESLRVEAQELLAQYQRKQRDAEKESEEIIQNAKKHAQKIQKAAEAEMAETMERREGQLSERLRRIEANAIAQIQGHAAELAAAATKEIIITTLDEKIAQGLAEESIKTVSKQLN